MNCPNCYREILTQNLNIQTDVAHCERCDHIFKISENISLVATIGFDMKKPPKGAWVSNELNSIKIGATTRSPIAFFLVPFMLVWSGGSIGGIYGSQFLNGKFDLIMSLFGIPFLIGSLLFWTLALMAIWGKIDLTVDKKGGKIFTGIGKAGITKKFTWNEISIIKEDSGFAKYPGAHGGGIQLLGEREIKFGSGLNSNRRYYIINALNEVLMKVKAGRNFF